ncbi:MAG: hypothetical protein JW806_05620 [Sedimentisphaerales bacterium]|nr:hypothetical protein [Sedimentisphaerales bacterium]
MTILTDIRASAGEKRWKTSDYFNNCRELMRFSDVKIGVVILVTLGN